MMEVKIICWTIVEYLPYFLILIVASVKINLYEYTDKNIQS